MSLILLSKNSQTAIFKRTPFSDVLLDSAENWVGKMSNMEEHRSVDGSEFGDLSAEQRKLLEAFLGMLRKGDVTAALKPVGPEDEDVRHGGGRGEPSLAHHDPLGPPQDEEVGFGVQHGIGARGKEEERESKTERVVRMALPPHHVREGRSFGEEEEARSMVSTNSRSGVLKVGKIKVDSMKVPRFTGVDINNWRINMEMFLEAAEVWDLVSGALPEPIVASDGTVFYGKEHELVGTEEDIKSWKKLNFYACTVLYGGMNTEMQRSVAHLNRNAAKIWKRLQDLYQRKAPLNRMYLLQEWKDFHMASGWTMKKYVVQYQELVERMKAYDLQMSEEAYVNQFLLGLSKENEVDRKMLSARDGLTLEDATNILLSEALARDMQRGKMAVKERSEPMANAAASVQGGRASRG